MRNEKQRGEKMRDEKQQDEKMRDDKMRKEALQVTKEIVVKFIETQRVSPTNFAEVFPAVYAVVCRSITDQAATDAPGEAKPTADSAS